MQQFKLRQFAAAALLAVGTLSGQVASAAEPSFTDLVIFGDSLSDTGNTSIASGGFYPREGTTQPYFGGRYSNGLLWTEWLASGLGAGTSGDAKPHRNGGNNYAYAGARTGYTTVDVPGLQFQVQTIWGSTHSAADPNALYVLVGGGNDMRDARSFDSGNETANEFVRDLWAANAASSMKASLDFLAQRGAKNVLISTLPDLGNTPEAAFLGLQSASSDATASFNAQVAGLMSFGASRGLNMTLLDMAGVVEAVRQDTLTNDAAVYGVLDIWAPCAGFNGSFGTPCAVAAFSDGLHPSARAHQIIADAAFQALGVTPVPEPETVALMLAGLVMVGSAARRRSRNAA